ncbi:MAG: polyprenyl synthetase family protein [Polyangiaceae bacterium]
MTRRDPELIFARKDTQRAGFLEYARIVKGEIDLALPIYFDDLERTSQLDFLAKDVAPVIGALRALVERGGKRLRGVLLAAAHEGCGGKDRAPILSALVSFELLQGYLLTHDDWIDQDEVRRGGPTVHAALRAHFDTAREAEIFAVLAGDFAAALSLRALCTCPLPEERIARASRAMGDMLRNVVLGQMYDVRGSVERHRGQHDQMRDAIDRVYELKTASYTAWGPLTIGATLAGATDAQTQSLAAIARPLGILFQLKDDLLGVYGDPKITGKSDSSDLRQGKFTALIVEASTDPKVIEELSLLRSASASPTANVDAAALIESLRDRITRSGARTRIEERIAKLLDEATIAIDAAELTDNGKNLLLGAAAALGGRNQ